MVVGVVDRDGGNLCFLTSVLMMIEEEFLSTQFKSLLANLFELAKFSKKWTVNGGVIEFLKFP